MNLLFSAAGPPAGIPASEDAGAEGALALLLLIAIAVAWIGFRSMMSKLRARKTHAATGGRFQDFVLEALVNAAKIDGRVVDAERTAIAKALTETTGATIDPGVVANAFAHAKLSKNELVAYLASRAGSFSREQKVSLLKALLSVFVADGRFHESEHAALVDYTEAVGFDREKAPDMLRGLVSDFRKGNIT